MAKKKAKEVVVVETIAISKSIALLKLSDGTSRVTFIVDEKESLKLAEALDSSDSDDEDEEEEEEEEEAKPKKGKAKKAKKEEEEEEDDEEEEEDDEEEEEEEEEEEDDEDEVDAETLAEADFDTLEDICDSEDLDIDSDDYDEDDKKSVEKFRQAVAKALKITLPKGKGKKK